MRKRKKKKKILSDCPRDGLNFRKNFQAQRVLIYFLDVLDCLEKIYGLMGIIYSKIFCGRD